MKKNKILKSCEPAQEISEEEINLINKYTRRKFTSDEVYVFSVVLCDNDIDRDYERFTVESLFKLEKLFIGKSSVFDHNPTAENQTARIFDCKVENIEDKFTSTGDQYFRLVARAYMPICEKNDDLILLLDSGIQKEVSVGCGVKENLCSICSYSINSERCHHEKGKEYNGKLCFGELSKPYDAYEWSFVAVPAQRHAGVIKSFTEEKEGNKKMEKIIKSIRQNENLTLTKKDTYKLNEYINKLEKKAEEGEAYRADLEKSVVKYSTLVQPEISRSTMKDIVSKLNIKQLKEFRIAYKKKASDFLPVTPQLKSNNFKKEVTDNNIEFKI